MKSEGPAAMPALLLCDGGFEAFGLVAVARSPPRRAQLAIQKNTAAIRFVSRVLPQYAVALWMRLLW